MEAVLAQVDQRFLLGELMPYSDRLEDRLYRELIRQSNRSVIEKYMQPRRRKRLPRIHRELGTRNQGADYQHCPPLRKIIKNDITRSIIKENGKIENLVERTLYYARSDEVYKDYIIQETNLAEVAAEVVSRNKYYFIQNGVQVEIDCPKPVHTDRKWIAFILNQILQKQPEIQA